MDRTSLLSRMFKLLPLFLILMLLMGIALYAIRFLLPNWQSYSAASDAVGTQSAAVSTQLAGQNNGANDAILQHQIDTMQKQLESDSSVFLTDAEAEQVLNRLYNYAYSRGVRIVNLQAQQAAQSAAPTAARSPRGQTATPIPASGVAPYQTTVFQLQVGGGVGNLIDFISRFQEASLPSVSIASMNVTSTGDQALLTMTLLIYTSPYASGEALNQLLTVMPTLEPPTDTPTPTPLPATATLPAPTATLLVSVTAAPPTATLMPSATFTPTITPTFTLTPTLDQTSAACVGAPPTIFHAGDIAVVHFSGLGALRVLSDPNGSVMTTRTQAYDNQHLEIIAGPVCANSTFYWYIRNQSSDNALGWVAEGKPGERWLCPLDDPQCEHTP